MQYLDEDGLNLLWDKIKATFQAQTTSLSNILNTAGTGFLKKGNGDSWSIDGNTYLTSIDGNMVVSALGYTPINANQKGAANGLATLDSGGKVPLAQISDAVLGQLVYGGTVNANNVATLSTNAKTKLGVTANTIQLTNDTGTYGYTKCEGLYFIMEADSAFAALGLKVGDWLIATSAGWKKVDNTDAVTGVKGDSENQYRIGNVNITKANIGLGNVENTALSTWSGTNKITTLGTITTGVWQGSKIADDYISSATTWNAKYAKPSTGIPKTDLASAVQTSLGKADSAVQDTNYKHITVTSTSVSDGTNTFNKYILPVAGSSVLGGIYVGHEAPSGTANIALVLDNNNKAYVQLTETAIGNVGDLSNNTTGSAAKLTTARTLWGVSFDGSANVTTAPNLYIGTTQVQTSSATQNLSGIGTLSASGVVTFSNTTEATAYNAASVKLSGGLGVAKSIISNGNISAAGGVSAHGISDLNVSGGSGGGNLSTLRDWASYDASDVDQVLGSNLGKELKDGKADKANITGGTAGTSSDTSGATIAIPYVTINSQGIVTNFGTHNHTLGSAATKTAGTANGNVPLLGAAASTTANVPAVFNASGALVPHSSGALGSAAFTASTAYLASNHAASGVTTTKISNWDTAYGWGNHASAGYLKSVAYNDLTTKPTSAQIQALVGNYVSTFAGKTGAITLAAASTTRGTVTLSISDSKVLSASVVLADWAKAASKPSYNFSEVGGKPTTISGYGITDAKLELTKNAQSITTAFELTLGSNVVSVGAIPLSVINALS